ncbi:MAG: ABC transporter ATP-binding protein [Pseudomonadota bacterium]
MKNTAISLQQVSKYYTLYENAHHRLLEIITGRTYHKTIKALTPISVDIPHGQVLGLIGNNGAGKSTLLKLITGTAPITEGQMTVNGRVVALLELGTGFHPELTGKENIYLYASIIGIKKEVIKQRYDEIVEFSGLEDFIHNPVKTYSSGMFMRLAFSVATSVDPDILIIDEALSVGDGIFAHKSFNRIMDFKEKGKTILFCSHSMYHINAICDRAIWLDKGGVVMDDLPSKVVPAYNASMYSTEEKEIVEQEDQKLVEQVEKTRIKPDVVTDPKSVAYIESIDVKVDGAGQNPFQVKSCESTITIQAKFHSDLSIATPHFGIAIENEQNYKICSAASFLVNFIIERDNNGFSTVELSFPKIGLLNGKYLIYAYLICDKGLQVYEQADQVAILEVQQEGLDLGVVHLDYQFI